MSTIIKKVKKGKVYYYAVQSGRVNGKPRIIWQKYLGTLDDILKRKDNVDIPHVKEVDIFQAGGVAALLSLANRIRIIDTINKIVPKRSQGPSVGEYILLAALNRVVGPCSKNGIPDWYQKTVLRRLWGYDPAEFDSQAFWNHMDLISENAIEKIQDEISKSVVNEFKLDPSGLLYDSTNFFTYVASGNQRNTIAQRGRNKQKRDDLRQVGLALLVTQDFHIPLFHRTYRGNQPDQGLFPEMAKEICESAKKVFKSKPDTTLAFDKGNISEKAMETLIASGQHIVAGIPKDKLPELFETPVDSLKPLSGLSGTRATSWQVQIWNITFKVVLAHTESFFISEIADVTDRMRKAERQLNDLNADIAKWKSRPNYKQRPTIESVKKRVKAIAANKYVGELIKLDIEENNGLPFVKYTTDPSVFEQLVTKELGKTMIISTRLDWSEEQIISAYRGLNTIESAFKHMKNREYLHWQPAFHWTDQKTKVHSLYCVLALLLASLTHKLIVESGINLSMTEVIDELEDIREVALIYDGKGSKEKKNQIAFSKMSSRQKKMTTLLGIEKILQG